MKYVEGAARMIADIAKTNTIVVEKSTVPVKAAESILNILSANKKEGVSYQILSNPEFLAEGMNVQHVKHNVIVLETFRKCHKRSGESRSRINRW